MPGAQGWEEGGGADDESVLALPSKKKQRLSSDLAAGGHIAPRKFENGVAKKIKRGTYFKPEHWQKKEVGIHNTQNGYIPYTKEQIKTTTKNKKGGKDKLH